jgi:hypothetical protein
MVFQTDGGKETQAADDNGFVGRGIYPAVPAGNQKYSARKSD